MLHPTWLRGLRRVVWLVLAGVLLAWSPPLVPAQTSSPPVPGPMARVYRPDADRLIDAALGDSAAYQRLGKLVDTFGHRLSGSASLEAAIDWILGEMKADGLENVHGETVMVPHWVRGDEWVDLVRPRKARLHMLGLGGSIGTPKQGITAPVLVVSSFDELTRRAGEARGKIVLFDVPFTTYPETVQYRGRGAVEAARVGAVGCLIRSVTSYSIRSPHTGAMLYDSTVVRIPAAALSVEDAMMLHRMADRGDPVVVTLYMEARSLPDAPSRNIVAELRGGERPDEVVVVGGHIDSWDVGQGAMDDGGGAVAAWEAVRLMKSLGLRPRRTVRVVLWTNEESGLRGARRYRDAHQGELERHAAAIESDNGVFTPSGVQFVGSDSALAVITELATLLHRIGADSVIRFRDSPEADIGPLVERGVPGLGLEVDRSRYFWYHHSDGDTLDKLDPRDMGLCVALMAVVAYVVADLPEPLPRALTP